MRSLGVGFSFAGIHCDDMQCELANNDESMHSFMEDFTVVSENVDGYDGAYYVGENVKEKTFDIRLLIEEKGDDVLARIAHWLKRGAYGKLIFDNAPYKYYNARVTAPLDLSSIYTKMDLSRNMFVYSGTIGVKLTAYVPYAYLLEEIKEGYPNVGDMKNTLDATSYVIEKSKRPAVTGQGNNISIIAANLGNAVAKPEIWITGRFPSGTVIKNNTTGAEVTVTTSEYGTYCLSSSTGTTTKWETGTPHPTSEKEKNIVYEMHKREMADNVKKGNFITLIPSFPGKEKLFYSTGSSGAIIWSAESTENINGYIYSGGELYKVLNATSAASGNGTYNITFDKSFKENGRGYAEIIDINEITVTAGADDTVEKVTVYFQDTFY